MRPSFLTVLWLIAAACVIASIALARADVPPAQIVKPFAQCDESQCVIPKKDWEAFQEFHAEKFAAMQVANMLLQQAQEQIEQLRTMLARYAGGRNNRRA